MNFINGKWRSFLGAAEGGAATVDSTTQTGSRVATNSGLFFSTKPPRPGVEVSVTTIEVLNATGLVVAYQDRPGHVRVDPVVGNLASRQAGGVNHPCTIAVYSVVVKWEVEN